MATYYLAHHGIKEQRWGIRRYQNKDGTLTPLGRERYGHIKKKAEAAYNESYKKVQAGIEKEKASLGIKSIDADTDILPKGIQLHRVTSGEDTLDGSRKYVSILKDDNQQYEADVDFLPLGDFSSAKVVEYEATGDIKVATYKKVEEEMKKFIGDKQVKDYVSVNKLEFGEQRAKTLLKKYGDLKLADLSYDAITYDALKYNFDDTLTKKEQKKNQWLKDYVDDINDIISNMSDKVVMGTNRESAFYDHMKKLGYDAFVDPVDGAGTPYAYPLVILDSNQHMKVKKEHSMYDD